MKQLSAILLAFLIVVFHCRLSAQSSQDFILQEYQSFLNRHKNITFSGIREMHPSADFLSAAPNNFTGALYADSIQRYYALNDSEIELLQKHSFVVSDRIRYESFGEAFFTIYKRDLPVYISSDAILHALHMSYSEILIMLETQVLLPRLVYLLEGLHGTLPLLAESYESDTGMKTALMDVDLYLTIPRLLLGEYVTPYYDENVAGIQTLMRMIGDESVESYPLFAPATAPRTIDFSQFTPRGHYTQSAELTRYFKAMMWLGRTEFYLIVPDAAPYSSMSQEEKDEIGRRQTTSAYLVYEALQREDNRRALDDINEILSFLVGESDNVQAYHLDDIKQQAGFKNAASFVDMETYRTFKQILEDQPFARQRILSQILKTDPFSTEKIQPAAAFMLVGQRFIIDSFVMGNVVYDKVVNPNRMLPKSVDVLFALGNNDALYVLEDELHHYNYAPNLAALRYIIDTYEPDYWRTSFFNLWLNAIRQLNPPGDRTPLPRFMQTEAWTHKTMTTQLASWVQLRHDNLLYGKQSYTGGPICSYPHSYVEPVPHFFQAIEDLAVKARESFRSIVAIEGWFKEHLYCYFETLEEIAGQLKIIAQKQIVGVELNLDEKAFLQGMLHESFMSYYEHVSINFKRLTDEEWATAFEDEPSMRPEFVKNYLSTTGTPYYDHRNYIITSVSDGQEDVLDSFELLQNYPNPFNAGTLITFQVPSDMAHEHVNLSVYNIQGQLIETLVDRPMPAGNYSVRWEGNSASVRIFTGYRLTTG